MEASQRKITFKVLFGYITLGILAAISGWLVLSELGNFTSSQTDDLKERHKLINISSLVADIYENESLARAALQLNTETNFEAYISQNERLMHTIDTLSILVNNPYQKALLDSVKTIFDKKQNDLSEVRNLKDNNTSEKSIEQTIDKLKAIDPILGKFTLDDYVENPKTADPKTKEIMERVVQSLNELSAKDSVKKVDQRQIDSIVTTSRQMLKKIQEEFASQKKSLRAKERELVKNDISTSRQLRSLLRTLEREMVASSQSVMAQRQEALDSSIRIISLVAIVSFILVLIFSVVILSDFWKTHEYRDELEKSNAYTSSLLKSREQLIDMVSHDLRSPLSTISGYSELLHKTAQNAKEGNYLDHIKNAASYMSQLVDDLLEFSKLEDGHITIERIPFNLQHVIKETSTNIKAIYPHKPIALVVDHDPNLDRTIVSDPFRINQILYNLIGNAYKFTEKGTVSITTRLENQQTTPHVIISVSDTGIGISKEKQQDIFNAFTQVNQSRNAKHAGFGLGLAISKKLVTLLKGDLTLESTPGKGSSFEISFPVKLSDQVLDTKAAVDAPSHFELKAVVVDDDVSLRQLITDILDQHHITTHTFEDAKAALNAMDHLDYDVVITDIQLPKMNGFHFMETVKQLPDYKQQPIIAMTGRTDIKAEEYIESGFSKVVFKPFTAHSWYDIFQELFPEALNPVQEDDHQESYRSDHFDTSSIAGFLNHDEAALKSLLSTFLVDTRKHMVALKAAQEAQDLQTINDLSHRMLTMFKQLKATTIIPHLELLEHTVSIDPELLHSLYAKLEAFCADMENYITPDCIL